MSYFKANFKISKTRIDQKFVYLRIDQRFVYFYFIQVIFFYDYFFLITFDGIKIQAVEFVLSEIIIVHWNLPYCLYRYTRVITHKLHYCNKNERNK